MPGRWFVPLAPVTSTMLALCAIAVHAAKAEEDSTQRALDWLDRMAKATETRNYDGTFVYRNRDGLQSMRIIHRRDADGERERLISLTGMPREVIRDGRRVTCILPDSRSVVVAKSRAKGVSGRPEFEPREGYAEHYHLSLAGRERVAGRETQVVVVTPKDEYRYGYRLSIDEATALLLKSELTAPDGTTLEEIFYTTISTPGTIPDDLLEPTISAKDFTWYRSSEGNGADEQRIPSGEWQAKWLPSGFMLSDRANNPVAFAHKPVEHFVYTDGLASVSVYIEHLGSESNGLEGPSNMGAVNAYGRVAGDYQIMAVGEVPAETVERIARRVERL